MKLKLRYQDYCDGCENLKELNTIGGHKRCTLYKKNSLPKDDTFAGTLGIGKIARLEICKKENEVEIRR